MTTKTTHYLVLWMGKNESAMREEHYRVIDEITVADKDKARAVLDDNERAYANQYGEGTLFLVPTGSGRKLEHRKT